MILLTDGMKSITKLYIFNRNFGRSWPPVPFIDFARVQLSTFASLFHYLSTFIIQARQTVVSMKALAQEQDLGLEEANKGSGGTGANDHSRKIRRQHSWKLLKETH